MKYKQSFLILKHNPVDGRFFQLLVSKLCLGVTPGSGNNQRSCLGSGFAPLAERDGYALGVDEDFSGEHHGESVIDRKG